MRYFILFLLRQIGWRTSERYTWADPANPDNIVDRIAMTIIIVGSTVGIGYCIYLLAGGA